jgi:pyridoxal phosphate enzyme (YggS family)
MIADNIKLVRDRIFEKCVEIGRNSQEIRLIAVSKNFGTDDINQAYDGGIKDFGENKAQELNSKFEILGNKVAWHFIGHLQRNKVKFAIRSAQYIHSVDSLSLANEINKKAERINKVQKILLQVKTSEEETKSGVETEDEVFSLVNSCNGMRNIELTGLMTIAPFTNNEEDIRKSFRYLCKLRDDLRKRGFVNIKEQWE